MLELDADAAAVRGVFDGLFVLVLKAVLLETVNEEPRNGYCETASLSTGR